MHNKSGVFYCKGSDPDFELRARDRNGENPQSRTWDCRVTVVEGILDLKNGESSRLCFRMGKETEIDSSGLLSLGCISMFLHILIHTSLRRTALCSEALSQSCEASN